MTSTAPRRAAALLLALVIVSLVPVIALGTVRSASRSVIDSQDEAHGDDARHLARSLVPTLLTWATAHEASPADERIYAAGFTPILELEHDDLRVSVHALDLSGRLHTDHARSKLRTALPAALESLEPTKLLEAPRRRTTAPPPPPLDAILSSHGVRIFPSHKGNIAFAQHWLTTHGTGALNLRSAPTEFLAVLLEGASPPTARELSDSDGTVSAELAAQIISAARDRTNSTDDVPLTDRSSAWGFVISVQHGPAVSRWWLVAEPASITGRTSTGAAWEAREFRRMLE